MPEIPQLNETQPILNVQQVNDRSSGHQAFAQVLSKLSEATEKQAEKINEEQSQAMYIHSVSNIEQVKTTSQMRLLEHPEYASRISEDMQASVNQIKEMAFVNKGDRGKLNAFADGASDEIALKATATNVHQTQLISAFSHYANWPDQLKAYQQALVSGDENKATDLQSGMISTLKGLVQTGAISPEQASSSLKTMHSVSEIASDHLQMFGGNTTARDYHTVTSNALMKGSPSNPNAPSNQNSNWLINYYNQDKSFQGVLADISNRHLPNPETFDSLPPSQRQHALLAMQGTQIADGIINSGEPYPIIEKTYQELNTSGRVLGYRDQATRNALETYMKELADGNYLSAISVTPQGGGIMQRFVNRNAAIQNSNINDSQKMNLLMQNKNEMVNAAVSYGESHHIPPELIKPIPSTDLAIMQNGFQLNQDPSIVLQTLGQYNKANQAYVAASLKTPEQRIIAQAISYMGNGVKTSDQLDFIAANQEGRNYDAIKYESSGVNDGKLKTRIISNLTNQVKFLTQQYNFMDAQSFQGAMVNSTLKYAKYLAGKNNDLTMSNWAKYVDEASAVYKNAFEQVSNTNYSVNPKQLPVPLNKGDLDVLAGYVTNKGYEALHEGINPSVFDSMQSRNPLKMRISPTNNIEAVDQNGAVYFSQPFTTNLLSHARKDMDAREVMRKKAISDAYEGTNKLLLNVR